jgi:tetratricopeptide (TPR) repeat protein
MNYLYLDESGQFKGAKTRRSIVGGIFIKNKNINDFEVSTFFKQFGFGDEPFHGMKLDNSDLSNVVDKLIDFCNINGIEPIIFIPKREFFVIDDTVTYINVLADGITKFFIKYIHLINDITIFIENRNNLLKPTYVTRINESIAKAIALYGSIKKNIIYNVKIQNKQNIFLQLSDAVVHTYYRLDVSDKSDKTPFDDGVKQRFKIWVEPYKIYIHGANSNSVTINEMINDGDYINALMHLANYQKNDKAVQRMIPFIVERLCQLNLLNLNTILYSILALCYDAVNLKRLLDDFESYVSFFIYDLLPKLEKKLTFYGKWEEDIQWTYCYGYMILLTLYNHKGDTQRFEQVYDQAQKYIASSKFDLDSLSSRLRIRVLYGVHLTNQYCFMEAYRHMSVLEEKITEAFAFLNESDENLNVKPRITGEIIGTKLQALMYDTLVNQGNWDEVRKLSNKAIENFEYSEDIQRQYQYRAQIETYAGNFDKAREYLAKSIQSKDTNDIVLLKTILQKTSLFALLHLLRIWYVEAIKNAEKVNYIYDVLTQELSNNKTQFDLIMKNKAYPVHTILRYLMILYGLHNSNTSVNKANEFFEQANMLFINDETLTMRTLQLSLYYDYIWVFGGVLKKDVKGITKEFFAKINKLLGNTKGLPICNYIDALQAQLKQTAVENWKTLWYLFPF